MFLNDFYFIEDIQNQSGNVTARVRLNAGHRIYAAHFPGNPITPGVVQLEMAKEVLGEVLGEALGRTLKLHKISKCKYLAILNPVTTPLSTFKIDYQETEAGLKINATLEAGETIFLKLSALYHR